jgi:hypothetical protein
MVASYCSSEGFGAVQLYMDESGNGNPSQPLIVGAVAIDDSDAEEIENRIRELFARLSARRSLAGLRSFEEFRRSGFHAAADPPGFSTLFSELMQDLFFKAYMIVTDRTSPHAGVTQGEKLNFMYVRLLSDLLLEFRKESELVCRIEQNDSLRQLFRDLPELSSRRAIEKVGRQVALPRLSVIVVPKLEAMSLAIVDSIMLTTSRWINAKYSRDVTDRNYRDFRGIEHFISLLYSLEQGRISSRKQPLV